MIPLAFSASAADGLSSEAGLPVSPPAVTLRIVADADCGMATLAGYAGDLPEMVSDPAVVATLGRALDLLQACLAVRDELPPIVGQAARMLRDAVAQQNVDAMRRMRA